MREFCISCSVWHRGLSSWKTWFRTRVACVLKFLAYYPVMLSSKTVMLCFVGFFAVCAYKSIIWLMLLKSLGIKFLKTYILCSFYQYVELSYKQWRSVKGLPMTYACHMLRSHSNVQYPQRFLDFVLIL